MQVAGKTKAVGMQVAQARSRQWSCRWHARSRQWSYKGQAVVMQVAGKTKAVGMQVAG